VNSLPQKQHSSIPGFLVLRRGTERGPESALDSLLAELGGSFVVSEDTVSLASLDLHVFKCIGSECEVNDFPHKGQDDSGEPGVNAAVLFESELDEASTFGCLRITVFGRLPL